MKKRIQVKTEKPQFTVITNLTYAQRDSWFGHTMQDLKMDLIYPEDNSRTYPCIVWICGGAWLQLDKSAHLAYLSELSRKGFVVASVQYRTSNETPLPGQIQDVKAGIRYLRAHAERFHINPEKFGVDRESLAGGYLTSYRWPLPRIRPLTWEKISNFPAACRQPAPGTRLQISAVSLR